MKFSIEMVLIKLWYKKLIFLVIVVQIAVGIYLLVASLDDFERCNNAYCEASMALSSQGVQMIPRAHKNVPIYTALKVDDFMILQKDYADVLDMQLIKALKFSFLTMTNNELNKMDLNLLFVSDDFLGMTPTSKLAYIGKDARQNIAQLDDLNKKTMDGSKLKNGECFDTIGMAFGLTDSVLTLGTNQFKVRDIAPEISTVVLNDLFLSAKTTVDEWITPQNSIFLPLAYYQEYAYYLDSSHRGNVDGWLKFEVVENDVGSMELYQMLDRLNALNAGQFSYQIDSHYLQLRETTMQLLDQTIQKMAIAISQLFMVAISSAGILYLILLKRIRNIAIAIMVGSTKKDQVFELLYEVYSIVLAGVVAGVLAYLLFNNERAVMSARTWFIVLWMGIVIGGIAASLSLIGIKRLTPVEILQRI